MSSIVPAVVTSENATALALRSLPPLRPDAWNGKVETNVDSAPETDGGLGGLGGQSTEPALLDPEQEADDKGGKDEPEKETTHHGILSLLGFLFADGIPTELLLPKKDSDGKSSDKGGDSYNLAKVLGKKEIILQAVKIFIISCVVFLTAVLQLLPLTLISWFQPQKWYESLLSRTQEKGVEVSKVG